VLHSTRNSIDLQDVLGGPAAPGCSAQRIFCDVVHSARERGVNLARILLAQGS
jgi:hypothetical protein